MTNTFYKIQRILLAALVAAGTLLTFNACNDDETTDGTSLYSFGPCPVLRGDNIQLIGAGLSHVSKVVFPGEAGSKVEVADFVSHSDERMEVTVPQEAVPGKLKLVVNGTDTITSKTLISYEEPISVESITPVTGLQAGDVVTITGDYLYNIATITFATDAVVEAEDFLVQKRKELQVRVPKAAVTGKITLSDGADTPTLIESEEELVIATASFASKSATDVTEGAQLTFTGQHLELVEQVVYPGDVADTQFTVSADGTQLTSTVPTGIMSGEVTLRLYSGAALAAGSITVPTIEFTAITPEKDVEVGGQVTLTGKLLNLVSSIILPGGVTLNQGSWTVSADGTQLTFTVPQGVVDGEITLVQNANISISGGKLVMKKEGNVIWSGSTDFGNWSNYIQAAATDDVAQAITGPGTLTVNLEQSASSTWWQIRFQYSDWSTCWEKADGIIELEAGQTSISVPVTATDVQHIQSEGFVINGCFITVKSIEFQANN